MKSTSLFFASLFFFCVSAFASPSSEGSQTIEKWVHAINTGDVEGVINAFAPDAIFVGTTTKTLITRPEGIKSYFDRVFNTMSPVTVTIKEKSLTEVTDTVVVFTGLDSWKVTLNGETREAAGRLTVVMTKRNNQWQIVNFHRSAAP